MQCDFERQFPAIKIKRSTVTASGRGFKVTIPRVWVDDLDLVNGTRIGAWMDEKLRLILAVDEGKGQPGAVKIRNYQLSRKDAGFTISLPQAWVDSTRVAIGDRLDIYRDTADRIIIVKEEKAA